MNEKRAKKDTIIITSNQIGQQPRIYIIQVSIRSTRSSHPDDDTLARSRRR